MPHPIFTKLGLGGLLPTPISLQFVDGSMKWPLGFLDNVPSKICDFFVLDDHIALDMVVDAYAHIIL